MQLTPEEQQRCADECYNSLKRSGRTCSGCHWQHLCKMGQDTTHWLQTEFLPAIDPTGQVFGIPRKEVTR